MNRNKETTPIHPAVLRAYSLARAIDVIALKALKSPNLTPQQIDEINSTASLTQLLIFRGSVGLIRNALSEFFAVTNTLTENKKT